MAKVRDILVKEPENFDLPLLLIDVNGHVSRFNSVLKYLEGHGIQGFDIDYVYGSVQLDLNGEDSFIVIYYKFPGISC